MALIIYVPKYFVMDLQATLATHFVGSMTLFDEVFFVHCCYFSYATLIPESTHPMDYPLI